MDGQCVTRLPDPPSVPSFCVSDLMCKSYRGQKKCAKQCCKSREGMDDACVECNRGGGCSKCDSGYELVRGACVSKASEFCSNDGQCDSKKCKRKCCKDKSGGMEAACEPRVGAHEARKLLHLLGLRHLRVLPDRR